LQKSSYFLIKQLGVNFLTPSFEVLMSILPLQETIKLVQEEIRKVLAKHIGEVPGMRIHLDETIPQNEVWFYGLDKRRHTIPNVTSIKFERAIDGF